MKYRHSPVRLYGGSIRTYVVGAQNYIKLRVYNIRYVLLFKIEISGMASIFMPEPSWFIQLYFCQSATYVLIEPLYACNAE